MKLELSLEVSPRAARRGAVLIAAGVAVFASNGVSAKPKHEFAADMKISASQMNDNFNELDAAKVTITPWVAYDPKLEQINPQVTLVTTTNAGSTQKAFWRRVGDSMEVRIDAAVPTCNVGNQLGWGLPPGYAPDLSKSTLYGVVGSGNSFNVVANKYGEYAVSTLNGYPGVVMTGAATAGNFGLGQICQDIGDGGTVRMQFTVPIAGWGVHE